MNIKWTTEKINELKDLISKKTSPKDMANIMGFTKSAITTKCGELRLSFNYDGKIINWNDENIKKLVKLNNEKLSHPEIAREFGCNVMAIHGKLSQLRLRSKNVNYFTEDEKQKLIELFNEGHTINYIAKILKRGSPYLCKVARDMGLISEKSKQIQEQLNLSKEGKRKCRKCNNIFPYTDEFFRTKFMCKLCAKVHRKGTYQSYMTNITLDKLLVLRIRTAYGRACKKGLNFDLTPEYLMELYKKQKGVCYYSGIKMEIAIKGYIDNTNTLSVDRVDSSRGYTKDNVVLCCDSINTMKMKLETSNFLDICKTIVAYQNTKNDNFHIVDDTKS